MKAAESKPKPGERIEVPSFWRCDCGRTEGVHREWCPCGKHRTQQQGVKK